MTPILDRYVARELWPPSSSASGGSRSSWSFDRAYQLTDLVIGKRVPGKMVLSLLLFSLPPLLSLSLPIAVLMAVLLAGGRSSSDFEVAAFKASGVSPLPLFRPFPAAVSRSCRSRS